MLGASRVVIVAGKGGVGKTTVTAVLARAAADAGQRVLVVELDDKPTLATLVPDLHVRTISAAAALDDYLRDHGFGPVASRLNTTGVIDVVGTAAPGIDDLVVLGKIKQLERSGEYDVVIVDGPAAGHAISMLMAASGVLEVVGSGPLHTQATEVLEMLRDPARCRVVLVTLAESTPVNEVLETAAALIDRVGVTLGPVVVNGVEPESEALDPAVVATRLEYVVAEGEMTADEAEALRTIARFWSERRDLQRTEIDRVTTGLDLPVVLLDAAPVAGVDATIIQRLADSLRGGDVGQ